MAKINEEQLNDARSRRRQNRECPLLIRDDGMLYPNVPLVAKKQNFRPYHGNPRATLEERMRYLQGFNQRRAVVFEPAADAPFELGKATAEEIVAFAMEEYGAVLDTATPLPELRQECYRLSQLPDMALPVASQQAGQKSVATQDQGVPTFGMGAAGLSGDGGVSAKPTARRGGRSTAAV